MSEEERARRADYLKKRKRKIAFRSTVLAIVLLVAVVAGVLAGIFNKTYYVSYNEKSAVDYGVFLKDNDFYEENYLGRDYAYIASLINAVKAEFNYELVMDTKRDVEFDYEYRIDAIIEIKNKASGKVLYAPSFAELPAKTNSGEGSGIRVREIILVDYAKYNKIANDFVSTYKLQDVDASLVLKMRVDVKSKSDEFDRLENSNDYVAAISVPLTQNTVEVKITSDVPATNSRILSYTTESIAHAAAVVAIIFGSIGLVLAIFLLIYINSSRNHDVTYESRKARLVAAYKSFIQRLVNHFDTDGYQILMLSEFDEMLEIRDTIQSPILMDENDDKTCTHFLIPTNTNILYVYEIKVGDYDDIYSPKEEMIEVVVEPEVEPAEEPATEPVAEPVAEVEPTAEEPKEEPEAVAEPEVEAEEAEADAAEAEPTAEELEEMSEEERAALLYLVHADPDFRFVEPEPIPEPEPEPEPIVIPVDAPVDVTVGEKDEEPEAEAVTVVAEPELTLTYKSATLIGTPKKAAAPKYGPRVEYASEPPYGPRRDA